MTRTMNPIKTTAYGHFERNGKIEVHGNHARMERTDVVISFIEGKSMHGNSALHIYLSPKEATEFRDALNKAIAETPVEHP